MARKNVYGTQVEELLTTSPELTVYQIAELVGCTADYVRRVRKKQGYMAAVPLASPTPEELDTVLEAAAVLSPDSIEAILTERGNRYGSFLKHAIITQRLKAVMADTPNWLLLEDDMVEALEMIAHKIGRILNGDPSYVDSWVDVVGYAQLVVDRLNGKER
jgi:hypothetical protein